MEEICLHDARKAVDKGYVGFAPNGDSIKPVHIANGVMRCIYGCYNRTKNIKRLALVSDAKGTIPLGNEIGVVHKWLLDNQKLEDKISESALESMRNIMQKLLSADKGVYVVKGLGDNMISYSAGSKYFLTNYSMYEDAGEFIGGVIRVYCPEMASYIKKLLEDGKDSITLLFEPVLETDMEVFTDQRKHEDLPAFNSTNNSIEWFVKGIKDGGNCLLDNFRNHPNPLTQLRLFNFFCIMHIIRYMMMLATFYCEEKIRPILLDFSGKNPSRSSVARMSEMSYTQMYRSINRFYAWGYAEWLNSQGYTKDDLLNSATPVYERKKKTAPKVRQEELDELWAYAKEKANKTEGKDVFLEIGEAMYDMLSLTASSHPVAYIREIGTAAGLLYPPDSQHPNKRFVISQDILEMLLRSCVNPKEVISGKDIRERLWDRFGIVIGGRQFEMQKFQSGGMILQIDGEALEKNFSLFAAMLESMGFAEIMADGVLQIRMGGVRK